MSVKDISMFYGQKSAVLCDKSKNDQVGVFCKDLYLTYSNLLQCHGRYKVCNTLQKRPQHNALLENVTFGIPVFHCYGHKVSCQVSECQTQVIVS